MNPARVEIAGGLYALSWEAPCPAPPEDVAVLERVWGPLPPDYLAFLSRANGVNGEIEDEAERGAHLFLHDLASVLQGCVPDALGLKAHDDWRRNTVLASNDNLLIGSYLAGGLIVVEALSDGGWEFVDILTDSQSEPMIGVETRHPTFVALLRDLKTRNDF